MKEVILSDAVWDDVLKAIHMERDASEPMASMTIKLVQGEPVMVTQEKYALKRGER